VHGLRSDRAVPDLSEAADLFGGRLDVVGVLGDALVSATLREAHVGVDLAGGHLGAERPDTEAGGHDGRCFVVVVCSRRGEVVDWSGEVQFNEVWFYRVGIGLRLFRFAICVGLEQASSAEARAEILQLLPAEHGNLLTSLARNQPYLAVWKIFICPRLALFSLSDSKPKLSPYPIDSQHKNERQIRFQQGAQGAAVPALPDQRAQQCRPVRRDRPCDAA
jgi:hypothetical protein